MPKRQVGVRIGGANDRNPRVRFTVPGRSLPEFPDQESPNAEGARPSSEENEYGINAPDVAEDFLGLSHGVWAPLLRKLA
jgi:hypothetical protein